MFSDEVLEKIFAIRELQTIDLQKQSAIIRAMEEILEEEKDDKSVSEQFL